MAEIDDLINQQVEDEIAEMDLDSPNRQHRRSYNGRVRPDAKAIANLKALPRPLKPPGRS